AAGWGTLYGSVAGEVHHRVTARFNRRNAVRRIDENQRRKVGAVKSRSGRTFDDSTSITRFDPEIFARRESFETLVVQRAESIAARHEAPRSITKARKDETTKNAIDSDPSSWLHVFCRVFVLSCFRD